MGQFKLILYTSSLCSFMRPRSPFRRSVVFTVSISMARNLVIEKDLLKTALVKNLDELIELVKSLWK